MSGLGKDDRKRCQEPFRCPVWAKTAELADERERRIRSAGGGWPLGRRLVILVVGQEDSRALSLLF